MPSALTVSTVRCLVSQTFGLLEGADRGHVFDPGCIDRAAVEPGRLQSFWISVIFGRRRVHVAQDLGAVLLPGTRPADRRSRTRARTGRALGGGVKPVS